MAPLRIRTEGSFRKCFGKVEDVVNRLKELGHKSAGIADLHSTWMHPEFHRRCRNAGIKPILGVMLNVKQDKAINATKCFGKVSLHAKNLKGIQEIYAINSKSWLVETEIPYVTPQDIKNISDNVIIINTTGMAALGMQETSLILQEDREVYQWFHDAPVLPVYPCHILPPGPTNETDKIANLCEDYDLPQGTLPHVIPPSTFVVPCKETPQYLDRLRTELEVIQAKGFQSYFVIVADLVHWAKRQGILVGPGRGSAAGSLVCYLAGITEVDPVEHGLMFERFIDLTRDDLPDIDIDFPEDKRQAALDYLSKKYGSQNVARIGTITRFSTKSILNDMAKVRPAWEPEIKSLKTSVTGTMGISDLFKFTPSGKAFVRNHPEAMTAVRLEGHARHPGCHPAGVIISADKVTNHCTLGKDGVAQVDKHAAQCLRLLKVDVLSLKTLTILDECRVAENLPLNFYYDLPLTDEKALDVFRNNQYTGIFQFEGQMVSRVAQEYGINSFEDIVTVTSIARPGPMNCGIVKEVIKDKQNNHLIFQEQIMRLCKDAGMSWEDISAIRKIMSKSLGEEALAVYRDKFLAGNPDEAIWNRIVKFGSYAFNKAHAVSYSMISYWCAYMKAHYPVSFAAACLNYQKEGEAILTEIKERGIKVIYIDKTYDKGTWQNYKGVLVGGFSGVKGIGVAKAKNIIDRIERGLPLLPSQVGAI